MVVAGLGDCFAPAQLGDYFQDLLRPPHFVKDLSLFQKKRMKRWYSHSKGHSLRAVHMGQLLVRHARSWDLACLEGYHNPVLKAQCYMCHPIVSLTTFGKLF